MSIDILGTSWDQCRSMVQYIFTSTETRRLVRTDSPGRPPRLSNSSWNYVGPLVLCRLLYIWRPSAEPPCMLRLLSWILPYFYIPSSFNTFLFVPNSLSLLSQQSTAETQLNIGLRLLLTTQHYQKFKTGVCQNLTGRLACLIFIRSFKFISP